MLSLVRTTKYARPSVLGLLCHLLGGCRPHDSIGDLMLVALELLNNQYNFKILEIY